MPLPYHRERVVRICSMSDPEPRGTPFHHMHLRRVDHSSSSSPDGSGARPSAGVPVTEHFARFAERAGVWDQSALPKWRVEVHKQRKPLTSFSRTTSATLSLAKSSIRRSVMRSDEWSVTRPSTSSTPRTTGCSLHSKQTFPTFATSHRDTTFRSNRSRATSACWTFRGLTREKFWRSFATAILPNFDTSGSGRMKSKSEAYAASSHAPATPAELGYEVLCRPEDADRLYAAFVDGLLAGLTPYGLAAVETLRMESGLLFVGIDYTPRETSPLDLSLDRFISVGKGEFNGREALASAITNPPKRLCTVILDTDEPPAYDLPIHADGAEVGRLTSVSRSPFFNQVIGLAILNTGCAGVGRQVLVDAGSASIDATVAQLPYHDPERARPRG